MKRTIRFLVILLALSFAVASSMAGTPSDSLTYYGHSFVKITTRDHIVIYIDPYAVDAFADSADIVLITHEHSDHNEIARVRQKPTCIVLRSANALVGSVYQSFSLGPVTVQAVPAYNAYHLKSSCVGYIVSFDGISLYHAGDTGNIPEIADLTSRHLTYALLPMDGTYTVTPEVATQMAATIGAQYDMPIHTMVPPDTYSDAIVARFTSLHKLVVHPGESIALTQGGTSGIGQLARPSSFVLSQNYPNPFNPTTVISGQWTADSRVTLVVYDLLGREVAVLADGRYPAGKYSFRFDGSNLSSGVYFYRLSAGESQMTRSMMLMKWQLTADSEQWIGPANNP